jgi:hypothetical protein
MGVITFMGATSEQIMKVLGGNEMDDFDKEVEKELKQKKRKTYGFSPIVKNCLEDIVKILGMSENALISILIIERYEQLKGLGIIKEKEK